jgi:hypothetical protein
MTPEEAKAHFTKLAQDAGLDAEQQKAVLQAIDNEKFRTNLTAGYKRHDEFSREMDAVRAEKEKLKTWYEKEELPKYQQYVQSAEELRRYKEMFGDIEDGKGGDGKGGNGRGNGAGAGMSKEEIDRYFEDKLKQRDSAYVDLMKKVNSISADHMKRFGEPLDMDAVEKIAVERGIDVRMAYKELIAPKEQAAMEARHKEDIEKAKAEAVRDFQSRNHLPLDSRPKEHHPYFDRKQAEAGKTDLDADRSSRDEFLKGWNDYEAEQTKQPV